MNLFYVLHGFAQNNKTLPTKIKINLKIAWMEKPPYTIRLNSSRNHKPVGLLRSTVWHFIELGCDRFDIHIEPVELHSMDVLKSLVQEGKVQVGLPIFIDYHGNYEDYENLHLIRVLDHPGFEFITTGRNHKELVSIILKALVHAWPLLLITTLLTAIAGVIVWALVRSYIFLC